MEAFNLSNFKGEKQSIMTKILRLLELCLAFLFFLWIVTRLPFFLSISFDFLRSPLFVFALSNVIIAALLAQSYLLSSANEEQIKDTCTAEVDACAIIDSDQNVNEEGENEEQTERRKILRRPETEKVREILYPEDKLSNEEFQRTIEAFIAKQMRFLREESC